MKYSRSVLFLPILLFVSILSVRTEARYNPGWKWRTIRTNYFTIYYPETHEAFAGRILSLTDEVHRDISGYFGVEPRRCSIVLNPGTDIFNGYYSPFPNRISLYETPVNSLKGFGGASDIVDLVFTHEYAHYIHITTRLGWYGALSRILGDGAAVSNGLSPLWAIEGIATVTETEFTDGGRGKSPYFRGVMMSFTEGEGLWGLNSAGADSPHSPPRGRYYLAGYFMTEYLNRAYGHDTFARINRYQARHPIRGTGSALKKVIGKSPKTFYREFIEDFVKRAETHKKHILADDLSRGTVVVTNELDDYSPLFWTERGTIKALRNGYGKKSALVEFDSVSGAVLGETGTGRMYNFSPVRMTNDGRLVYGAVYPHPLGGGDLDTADLAVFDPGTGEHRRLTHGGHIFSADLSPDGSTFVAVRRNGMWTDIVLLDADGTHLLSLVSSPGLIFDCPVWSPDGSHIAAAVQSGQYTDIVLIDPATGEMKTLFEPDRHRDTSPSFSPDSRWIVFSSSRSGVWNIHAWDMENERLFQLTSVLYNGDEPKVSPDSSRLAFTSMHRGVRRICTIPFEPEKGRAVPVGKGTSVPEPDLGRLQPYGNIRSADIPVVEAYKPFIHAPWFSSDEKGMQAGFLLYGADPVGLHSYSASLLYGIDTKRPGYDIRYTTKSFWPVISARLYDGASEGNTVGGGRARWFRERGGELSLGLDVIHRISPSVVMSDIKIGGRTRRFDLTEDAVFLDGDRNRSVSAFGNVTLIRRPDYTSRDMTPGLGSSAGISYEYGIDGFGGELPGHNLLIAYRQFVPSLVKHHGMSLSVAHQDQHGFLRYDKTGSVPRGYGSDDYYGGLYLGKTLTLSAEYHFPLLFADTGIGLILYHMDLLKGSVFVDYGAGWDGGFDMRDFTNIARTSAGFTLTTRSNVLNAPLEFGVAYGYKTRERESFVHFLLGVNL